MKNEFSLKKPIRCGMVITIWLCLITMAACNPNEKEAASENPELYRNYLFEKLLYINPLSSYYISDGYVEYYTFSRDALVITDKTGLQRNIPVQYKEVAVNPVYRLYLMDGEVWLARMNNGSMWSIYKLTRYNGDIPSETKPQP